MNNGRTIVHAIILLLITATICGCAAEPQPRTVYKAPLEGAGELYFYLQPLPQELLPLRFTIGDLSVVSDTGERTALLDGSLDIRGSELAGVQKRLASP